MGDIISHLFAGALDNLVQNVPDDVSLALGFELGSLGIGEAVVASLQLSGSNNGGLHLFGSEGELFFSGTATVVPEPITLVLLGSGLTALGFAHRRRQSRER